MRIWWWMSHSDALKRLCLQKVNEQDQLLNRIEKSPCPILEADLERLVTIFNVSEPFPDLELAYLVKMKDLVNKRSKNALEIRATCGRLVIEDERCPSYLSRKLAGIN